MTKQIKAKLIEKIKLNDEIYRFKVRAPEIVRTAKPGNFVEIRVSDSIEPFLRRPISIYNIEKEEEILEFIFQVKGKGTKILSEKKQGDLIDLIGPLGLGTFEYEKDNNTIIIRYCYYRICNRNMVNS